MVNTRIDAKDLDCKPAARFAPGTLGRDQPLQPLGLPEYHRKGPLAEPLGEGLQAAVDAYLDFLENQEYSSDNFGAAAKLGTQVLKEGKGWKEANRALRRCSLERHGNHFEELHGNFFEGSFGKGRALIAEDQGSDLLAGVVSVPMARVPKMLPDRTLSTKGRVIWDATVVNRTCAKENHPPALQPRHSEMARSILWWKQRFPFARVLLSKKDISDAFKWVPVQLDDTRLFAADLPGKDFGLSTPITVIYNTLTFGWTGAPGEFMLYAWVAKLAHQSHVPEDPLWNDCRCQRPGCQFGLISQQSSVSAIQEAARFPSSERSSRRPITSRNMQQQVLRMIGFPRPFVEGW